MLVALEAACLTSQAGDAAGEIATAATKLSSTRCEGALCAARAKLSCAGVHARGCAMVPSASSVSPLNMPHSFRAFQMLSTHNCCTHGPSTGTADALGLRTQFSGAL